MQKIKTIKAICVLLSVLVVASLGARWAMANGTVELSRQVLSSGASDATASGEVIVRATLGQPMIGPSGHGSHQLCAGFWCGAETEYAIYLPVTLRNM